MVSIKNGIDRVKRV